MCWLILAIGNEVAVTIGIGTRRVVSLQMMFLLILVTGNKVTITIGIVDFGDGGPIFIVVR